MLRRNGCSGKVPQSKNTPRGKSSIHADAPFCAQGAKNLIGALKVGGPTVEIQVSQMMCSNVQNYRQIINSAAITLQVAESAAFEEAFRSRRKRQARYVALAPSDQILLLPRGYSFFNSAVQFNTTVMGSDEVVPVSTRTCLPSGATSQPKTRKACSLWPI
jgi:hypothetical protein